MAIGTAAAILGGSLIGGAASLAGASKQSKSAKTATSAEERMFERNVALQEPWRQSGIVAQNELMTLLGLTPPPAPPAAVGGVGDIRLPTGALGTLLNRLNPSVASAAPPMAGGGVGSGLQVNTASPDFGRYAKEFGMDQFQADPGYAFRMAEGMKALERSAAARGGLISGGAMKGIQRFGQDLASQEYTNAFNRYQAERTARLNPLLSLAGAGQITSQQLGQAGMQLGQNIGENLMSGANARASGYMGVGNALNQGLGAYLNYSQDQNLLKLLQPTAPAPGP
jgi:hypothetical protein